MTKPVVCYLERAAGGALFRRVRLMCASGPAGPFDRTWTAPALNAQSSGGEGESAAASESVNATRAAARWVAESLAQLDTKSLTHVCVDPEGSLCTWLSAPSADPSVITATLMNPDQDDGSGGGSSGGAARLLALGAGSSGGFSPDDASVQALATLDPPGASRGLASRLRPRKGSESLGLAGERERYAVLAVPDAPVRVFLDELDSRGIEVLQVTSLWHAMATAWDPSAAHGESAGSDRVVSSYSPASAIVLVDPIGRLVWAWSQAGQLVTGGAMRLRAVQRREGEAEQEGTDAEQMARRVASESAAVTVVEFTEAEAGRLVMDWLSWSAQLGHCPQQVACIGPAPAVDAAVGTPDPSLIGQALGRAWPGATIGVGIHADPIGATLQRLIGVSAQPPAPLPEGVAVGPDDPRASLVGLSSRPGRIDRGMYTWMAIGVAAAAFAVGAVGFQLHQSASGAEAAITAATKTRKEHLEGVEDIVKGISIQRPTDARDSLTTKIDELKKQIAAMKAPRPFLAELGRVFQAMDDHDGVVVNSISIGPVSGTVDLTTPDRSTGPAIVDKLIKLPGTIIRWQGTTPPGTPPTGAGKYIISGPVITEERRPGGGA